MVNIQSHLKFKHLFINQLLAWNLIFENLHFLEKYMFCSRIRKTIEKYEYFQNSIQLVKIFVML